MDNLKINELIQSQRDFFNTGITKDAFFRLEQLDLLKKVIIENEKTIFESLKRDLNKPPLESYIGETALVIHEIDYALKNLRSWTKPRKVKTPLAYFPCSIAVYSEPYGVALIIGPWNFPVQLILSPLVGAVAAGNCAILKPSEEAPHTSRIIAKIINKNFDSRFLSVVEGDRETAQELLKEKFDYIFFTGGPVAGKLAMAAAAKHLTPVTLELGGKNPCIVDFDVHLEHAARRIVWGKFFNAGQSCVAPDYLLVDARIKQDLLLQIERCVQEFYGADPSQSPDYCRIINENHFLRLTRLLDQKKIVIGGKTNPDTRYIAPTVIEEVSLDDPLMEEEIFGPILPVIEYNDLTEAIAFVNERPKPLALYFFSRNKKLQARVFRDTYSGGGCINDTVLHESITALPFGGVGESGIGRYHGKASFDTFSYKRSILRRSFLFDPFFRYLPYLTNLKLIKWRSPSP